MQYDVLSVKISSSNPMKHLLFPPSCVFIILLQDTELLEGAFRLLVRNYDNFQRDYT